MADPHQPARSVSKDPQPTDKDLRGAGVSYPDLPSNEPGLVGGPATEAVPGSHGGPATVTDDGGETTLPGRPRETGGDRPPKKIPKTEGS